MCVSVCVFDHNNHSSCEILKRLPNNSLRADLSGCRGSQNNRWDVERRQINCWHCFLKLIIWSVIQLQVSLYFLKFLVSTGCFHAVLHVEKRTNKQNMASHALCFLYCNTFIHGTICNLTPISEILSSTSCLQHIWIPVAWMHIFSAFDRITLRSCELSGCAERQSGYATP